MGKFLLWLTINKEMIVFAGLVLLLIALAWQIDSCRTRKNEQKKEILKEAIREGKTLSNVQENTIIEAANKANKANENVNAVRNTPATQYSNSFDEAKRKFCVEFPTDPICAQ